MIRASDGGSTGHSADPPRTSPRAWLGVSRVGVALFIAALGLEHVLAPQLGVEHDRISEYAVRGVGWLMTGGFVAWAVALAATARLAGDAIRGARGLALSGLLAVAATGMLVTAGCATQAVHGEVPADVARTTEGHLHDLGSGAVFVALVLALALSLHAVSDARIAAAIAIAVTCVAWLALPLIGLDVPALAQRMMVLAACAWHWTLAAALTRCSLAARDPVERTPHP